MQPNAFGPLPPPYGVPVLPLPRAIERTLLRSGAIPPTVRCGILGVFAKSRSGWIVHENERALPPYLKCQPKEKFAVNRIVFTYDKTGFDIAFKRGAGTSRELLRYQKANYGRCRLNTRFATQSGYG
jgi:hypothetical protein